MKTIVLGGIRHNVMRYTKNTVTIMPSGFEQSPIPVGPAQGKSHVKRLLHALNTNRITLDEYGAAVEAVRLEQL